MALKKSELYSSLWQSCDELRGGMDASQYKDYILVLLFIKYVSVRRPGAHLRPQSPGPGNGAGVCHLQTGLDQTAAAQNAGPTTRNPARIPGAGKSLRVGQTLSDENHRIRPSAAGRITTQPAYPVCTPRQCSGKSQSCAGCLVPGFVKEAVPPLIQKWEPILDVSVKRFTIQHMKTRWGSCTHEKASIRLNTELAKKPPECLEYIVVHEMVHLLEPTHNAYFIALMDKFLPHWVNYRNLLNDLPVRHEDWGY